MLSTVYPYSAMRLTCNNVASIFLVQELINLYKLWTDSMYHLYIPTSLNMI